jgi:hypothetical protein
MAHNAQHIGSFDDSTTPPSHNHNLSLHLPYSVVTFSHTVYHTTARMSPRLPASRRLEGQTRWHAQWIRRFIVALGFIRVLASQLQPALGVDETGFRYEQDPHTRSG